MCFQLLYYCLRTKDSRKLLKLSKKVINYTYLFCLKVDIIRHFLKAFENSFLLLQQLRQKQVNNFQQKNNLLAPEANPWQNNLNSTGSRVPWGKQKIRTGCDAPTGIKYVRRMKFSRKFITKFAFKNQRSFCIPTSCYRQSSFTFLFRMHVYLKTDLLLLQYFM